MHDDQHGTAIVALAGLINSMKITGKKKESLEVVINGPGAAGTAILKLLKLYGIGNVIMCDSKGILSSHRNDIDSAKRSLLPISNKNDLS